MTRNNRENDSIISDTTPVRIGLIIGFLAVFGSGIWWCSSISSKLDTVLSTQTTANSSIADLKTKDASLDKDLSEIKLKQALMEVDIKSIKDLKK